jgi:transcriptional regulator with XRE-family HTH domain
MADALVKYDRGLNLGPAIEAAPATKTIPVADAGYIAGIAHQGKYQPDTAAVSKVATTTTGHAVGHDVATAGHDVATIEPGVHSMPVQPSAVQNTSDGNPGSQSVTAFPASSDHFAFNEKTSSGEDVLVLDKPVAGSTASVDVHVGQRMRQRRWMMGMTQQQLGDLVGVKFEQIQKYEAGAIHIGAGRMWDVAAAMEVPMSYFFEGIEGQAADTGEARSEILTGEEAEELVLGAPQARKVQAS